MRSEADIHADARPGRAFSNGTSWEIWESGWCDECKWDGPFRRDEVDQGCPILLVALVGEAIPSEWKEVGPQDYECSEFVPDRGHDGAPAPPPPPPDPPIEVEGQQDILGVWAQQAIDRAQREQPVRL